MPRAKAAAKPSNVDLAKAILKALQPSGGRSHRCPRDELSDRLVEDGVTDLSGLDEALAALWDVGQIILTQRNAGYPLLLVAKGDHPFDSVDELAANVCIAVKRRGEEFASDEELRSYLDEDEVAYDAQSLTVALRQLEELGRIRRFRADQWHSEAPLPGLYVPPRIFTD